MNWQTFGAAHRRALIGGGVVAVATVAFAAGAFAGLGDNGDGDTSKVQVENVNAALDATTTLAPTTTTTAAPETTTVPTTTLPPPPPPPPPTTTKPPPPPPPASSTYTFEAPGAGSMTVKLENGVLSVVAVNPVDGWAPETHTASGSEFVKVIFRQGTTVKWVKARLKNGAVTPETGEWTECNTTPPPGTATYELPGIGSVTVTWNGTAFTLDATQPSDGWTVAATEAPGDYVRVYFAPVVSEPTAMTGGEQGAQPWIKVKIQDCQITQLTG